MKREDLAKMNKKIIIEDEEMMKIVKINVVDFVMFRILREYYYKIGVISSEEWFALLSFTNYLWDDERITDFTEKEKENFKRDLMEFKKKGRIENLEL